MCQQTPRAHVSIEKRVRPAAVNGDQPSQEISLQPCEEAVGLLKRSSVGIALKQTLPDFLQSVNVKYVKLGYHYLIKHFTPLLLLCTLAVVLVEVGSLRSIEETVIQLWRHLQFNLVHVLLSSGVTAYLIALYIISRPKPTYIVDFACYKAHPDRKCTLAIVEYFARRAKVYSEENIGFLKKVFLRSGLGEETYLPPFVFHEPPVDPSMKQARVESEEVMFGALDELFLKTKLTPKDIDILIVNCSCFTPTPSLTSIIVNHYKMRSNIHSVNLSGMGCSAGMISIDLAKDLLQSHPNSYAIVVSTENITFNWYGGNKRSMLVSNCLFRVGGAAILLTNKRSERSRAKYELIHTVRVHRAPDDKSFQSVIQEEDDEGVVGVSLSKHLMVVAGDALKINMTTLGPLVLPFSEQFKFLLNLISRKVLGSSAKPYIPDFKLAFDHFLLHAGGRGVLDELQANLKLSDFSMEPSRMTLHRFGNTSSSCLWYELAYLEAKERVKKGDRLWQVGIGSGFKCNSVVWKALRALKRPLYNPWLEFINNYPEESSKVIDPTPRCDKVIYKTLDGKFFDCTNGRYLLDDEIPFDLVKNCSIDYDCVKSNMAPI